MAVFVLNAFSLNMIPSNVDGELLDFERLSGAGEARAMLITHADDEIGFISGVGHADTAAVFAAELELTIPINRVSVELQPGDIAIIGQYKGPRLPEGATQLPEGAAIEWWQVQVMTVE